MRRLTVLGLPAAAVSFFLYVQGADLPPYLQATGFFVAAMFFVPLFFAPGGGGFPLAPLAVLALALVSDGGSGAGTEPLLRLGAAFLIASGVSAWTRTSPRAAALGLSAWSLAVAGTYLACAGHHPAGLHGPPFGNGNVAGGFFVAPFSAAAWFLFFRPSARVPAAALLAASGWALWRSDSQSAWAAAIGVFLFCSVRGLPRRLRPWAMALSAAAVLGLAVLLWSALPDHPLRARWEHLVYETSAGYRLLVWRGALAAWWEAPWLGHGPGSFWQAFSTHRPPDLFLCRAAGAWEPSAHSVLLETLVETGFFGAAAFFGTAFFAIRRGFASGDPARGAAALSAAALLANGLASVSLSYPQAQAAFWASLWIAGGWGRSLRAGVPSAWGSARRAGAGIALLILFRYGVYPRAIWLEPLLTGHLAFREAVAAPRGGDGEEARWETAALRLEEATRGMERTGAAPVLRADTLLMLARARSGAGDLAAALRACRGARRLAGTAFPVVDETAGLLYAELEDPARSVRHLAAAARAQLYRRPLFTDYAWTNPRRGPVPPAYWEAFLPFLKGALAFRRWDLEIMAMRAIFLDGAQRKEEAAAARQAADALHASGEDLATPEGIVAYARAWHAHDPKKAETILARWESARGPHPAVAAYLERIRKAPRQ